MSSPSRMGTITDEWVEDDKREWVLSSSAGISLLPIWTPMTFSKKATAGDRWICWLNDHRRSERLQLCHFLLQVCRFQAMFSLLLARKLMPIEVQEDLFSLSAERPSMLSDHQMRILISISEHWHYWVNFEQRRREGKLHTTQTEWECPVSHCPFCTRRRHQANYP